MTTTVRVARDLADVQAIIAIRGACFLSEQECPYEEEFSCNDFAGTLVLALVDDKPAATCRVRYFNNHPLLEHVCCLPRFRSNGAAQAMKYWVYDFLACKGFDAVYGQARFGLIRWWEGDGWEFVKDETGQYEVIKWSDHRYVRGVKLLFQGPPWLATWRNLNLQKAGPYPIRRPEGEWDRPGPLERSAERGATEPGGERADPFTDGVLKPHTTAPLWTHEDAGGET
jgi:hypothetical protein